MADATYIHGTDSAEQERLALLNRLTNQPFIDFLALDNARSILDLGSGLGILAEQVRRSFTRGVTCGGLEFAAEQLELQRTDTILICISFKATPISSPFPDERFAVVYCRYLLEHVADPRQVLSEAYRVLQPGGKVCLQENNILVLVLHPHCPHFESYGVSSPVYNSNWGRCRNRQETIAVTQDGWLSSHRVKYCPRDSLRRDANFSSVG